jgi:exodeoxyribonuclease-3
MKNAKDGAIMLSLASWNVNGLRACMTKGFMDFVNNNDFDILALQETKMWPEQADFTFPGYQSFWNKAEKKGYSGTLVLSKTQPLSVTYGMEHPGHDTEGRIITAEYEKFILVNVYTPNAQRELARLDYRMDWEETFRAYLLGLSAKKPVVVCGDLNVAHTEMDIKNAKSNVKNAGFTPQEREKMTLLLNAGFVDTFRHLYPDKRDAYTWWSFMGNSRGKNVGWRIDYFLVSKDITELIKGAFIYDKIFGSDHCPVGLALEI